MLTRTVLGLFRAYRPVSLGQLRSSVLKRAPVSRSKPRYVSTAQPLPRRGLSPRFFSSNTAALDATQLPLLTPPVVGRWLLISATLVFGVVVVGGVTRLTESGLSITEWRPVTGILPPLSDQEWDVELTKYKETPEFKLLNSNITMPEFKRIFYMEYSHRVLGRIIGLAFVLPLTYFALRRRLAPPLPLRLTGLAALLGLQGVLGWYMVQSGLHDSIMDTPGAIPRVSQYRLAAHLGAALVLYAGMFGTGMAVVKDYKFAQGKGSDIETLLRNPRIRRFKVAAWALTGLVFLTAMSGAFVAGLDAGLIYNEFPLMGGRISPPASELFSQAYAKAADLSDLWWRNIFENPSTVQFSHRVLATTTYISTGLLYLWSRRTGAIYPLARTAAAAAFAAANLQVALGITALLYLVPVPVAAAHQAGSVALLSACIHLLVILRRPGLAARIWRTAKVGQDATRASNVSKRTVKAFGDRKFEAA